MKYILEKIKRRIREQMQLSMLKGIDRCDICIYTKSGYIDVSTNYNDRIYVDVGHYSSVDKYSPLLTKAIEDLIPKWSEVENLFEHSSEWKERGYQSKASFIQHFYGRGFKQC